MPKQTFFNLPVEKQNTLIEAAKKEFSRVPLHEALISNIIKSAKVSRGSFYQYFEDLDDLFFYILEEHVKRNNEQFSFQLKKNKGDIFEAFIILFKSMLRDFQNEDNRVFFKNAFLNMSHKVENAFTTASNLNNFKNQQSEILGLIDTTRMNIVDEKELFHVMKIIQAVTFQNIIQSFATKLTYEEAIRNYTLEMKMLKEGLYRDGK